MDYFYSIFQVCNFIIQWAILPFFKISIIFSDVIFIPQNQKHSYDILTVSDIFGKQKAEEFN